MNRSLFLLATIPSLVLAYGCEGDSNNPTGIEMVSILVPAGSFWQGCNESVDTKCLPEERPYHEVNVPAFEIDKYEVTVFLYRRCVDAGFCSAAGAGHPDCNWRNAGKDDHPVNCISWDQMREYCAWAGKRLCSESEWEKASRGTDGRIYPWGNQTATCQYAVMYEGGRGCGTDSTWPVGSKPAGASPYGAMDMSGNVWEWVEDEFHTSYSGAPTNGSAWVDNSWASFRVWRGGSFGPSPYDVLRSSSRYVYDPAYYGGEYFGGRCCRSLER
jgi:formylglycine-generating enzyme required for sulfatase activity